MSELTLDDEFLQDATPLTNFEAAKILRDSVQQGNNLYSIALSYAEEFSKVRSQEDLNSIKHFYQDDLTPYQIATLVNLMPTNPDSARTCCRLGTRTEEEIDQILQRIRRFLD